MNQFPFFVYGTLLPGQPNSAYWQEAATALRVAHFVGGALYDLAWYPMLVLEPGGVAAGLLVAVEAAQYARVLRQIDFLEGYDPTEPEAGDNRRRLRLVTVSGEGQVAAWVYVGRAELVAGRPRLTTNWAAHAQRRRQQLSDWWQQVETVRGLGSFQESH